MSLYKNMIAKANQRTFLTTEAMMDFLLREIDNAGFQIVPKEPTDDMVEGAIALTKIQWLDIPGSKLTVNREKTRMRYCAMLGRAPNIKT